jgi:hypothetical protein
MAIKEKDIPYDIVERAQATADMVERKLMRAVGAAETELARVIRMGEADMERLAVLFIEITAKLANTGASGVGDAANEAGVPLSGNQVAVAIARAMLRGSRFS